MKKGFTLIELLIVVLIIGILAAIALPQYQMSTMKTRYLNLMTLTEAIAKASERYYLAQGVYATTFDALDVAMPEGGQSGNTSGYNYINYDWGYCMLIAQQSASCRSTTSLYNAHIIYYNKSSNSSSAGKILCFALSGDAEDKYNKLCKQLTARNVAYTTANCTVIGGTLTCRGYFF